MVPPHIPIELLEYLKAFFPDRLPPLSVIDREFGRLHGRQDVIRHLETIHETQKEEAYNVSS